MSRLIAKPVIVDAHQFILGRFGELPQDFRFAIRRHVMGGVEVTTGDGPRVCRETDWIVRGPDGLFSVQRASAVEAMFEEYRPVVEPVVKARKVAA